MRRYLSFLSLRLSWASLLCLCFLTCGGPSTTPEATTPAPATTTALASYVDLTPAEFAEKIGAPNTVLIDVRTPGEIAEGKIEGALEMDYRADDFAQRLAALDPSKTYLVYCASGGRSARASKQLFGNGAARVYNLEGGYSAWVKQ